ncbi:MAG: regulator of sigma E protease [Chloroflexi bacterium]|jgi:regulator of sigma E protease|nr:MAG: regulator of sigma E protease [Chloroflexota bacterium]
MDFILDLLRTILAFIGVLAILVLVHELGHFLMARLFKVKVLEFGFGYPPRLFGFRRGETLYSMNLLPLGGFVKLLGEEDPTEPRSLASLAPWKRAIILVAGSGMNVLLPIVIFTVIFMLPQTIPRGNVLITEVAPGGPAAGAGIVAGDRILEVNGNIIDTHSDVGFNIQLNLGNEMTWLVEHEGAQRQISLTPRLNHPRGEGPTGVAITTARIQVDEVPQTSQAWDIGVRPGDVVLQVGGYLVFDKEAISLAAERLTEDGEGNAAILLWRQGEFHEAVVPGPAAGIPQGLSAVVISNIPGKVVSYPPWRAVPKAVTQIGQTLVLAKNEISRWIVGSASPQLAGPIGIAQLSGQAASLGFLVFLNFAAFLSINLAIINILPIPMLDGGRLMFVIMEWVRRGKRVSPKREGFVHLVGFMLLLSMIVIISYYDIARLIQGRSLLP